ncbi:MAG TPA: ribbon-helix-helix domain-containing protein [Alphaproteobacteria bacterium]
MKKRSVTIAGHRSSITLEDAFWQELQLLAKSEKLSLNALITRIDDTRPTGQNLSSALRLYILDHLKKLSAQ